MERVYHVARIENWKALEDVAPGPRATLTGDEGVGLYFREDLRGALAKDFDDTDAAILLEIDGRRLGEHLILEATRQDAGFPRVDRALALDDILGFWNLTRGYGELFRLPTLGRLDPARDLPQRSPIIR